MRAGATAQRRKKCRGRLRRRSQGRTVCQQGEVAQKHRDQNEKAAETRSDEQTASTHSQYTEDALSWVLQGEIAGA